jgi:RimJ/RimL family protein N-acetyltransferase
MARWGTHEFPYHAFNLDHLSDRRKASAALASVQESKQHRHFVACENGVAVGRLSLNLKDSAGLYIWAVHVPPEHEGRGIARRMVALLMDSIESVAPGPDFVLATHTFAERAHRAYRALGFAIAETKWTFDTEIARELWKVDSDLRAPITEHIRFRNGRWEVRTYIMRRERGSAGHAMALFENDHAGKGVPDGYRQVYR